MKLHFKLYLILFFLSAYGFSQKEKEKNSAFQSYPELKIYGGIPVELGNNFLHNGHDPQFDFGFYISPFSIYHINFGIGFDYSRFKVSDVSLVGNGTRSNTVSIYGYLSYPISVSDKIDFEPKLGVGGTAIRQKRNDQNFGEMNGVIYNLGANLEYKLDHPLAIFMGADYFYSKFNVAAPDDYKNMFENVGKINVFAGIKFNFRKKKNPQEESDN